MTPDRLASGETELPGAATPAGDSLERAVERSLREQSTLLLALSENLPDVVTIVDRDHRYRFVNGRAREITGRRIVEMVGRTPAELGFPDSLVDALGTATDAVFTSGRPSTCSFDFTTPDGLRHFEARVVPIPDADGHVESVLRISRDVTRSRELEEQLRQSLKLETVGRLAGGIAHDFNNILTVIVSAVGLAIDELPADAPPRKLLAQVRDAGERASALTRQLLSFGRRQVLSPERVDVNALIRGAGRLLRRLIGENSALEVHLDSDTGVVHVDPSQLEQVLVQLAVNARDAMPDGGTLTIETSNAMLDADALAGHPGALPGAFTRIVVRDTGHGFTPEVRSRLFEPFFTTRPRGQGAGLGLATCYGIVQQSGGLLRGEGQAGRGALFEIFLPHAPAETATVAPAEPAPVPGGRETVLLVEDEDAVREIAGRILRGAGYHVLSAPGGEQALQLLAAHDGPLHLLLTDVIMPGMNGPELARHVQERRPEAQVLFTSGYTAAALAPHGVLEPGLAFLPKPYAPDDLLRKVRAALTSR